MSNLKLHNIELPITKDANTEQWIAALDFYPTYKQLGGIWPWGGYMSWLLKQAGQEGFDAAFKKLGGDAFLARYIQMPSYAPSCEVSEFKEVDKEIGDRIRDGIETEIGHIAQTVRILERTETSGGDRVFRIILSYNSETIINPSLENESTVDLYSIIGARFGANLRADLVSSIPPGKYREKVVLTREQYEKLRCGYYMVDFGK